MNWEGESWIKMIVLRRRKRERWISFGVSSQKKRSRSSFRKKSQTIRKKERCRPGQTFGYLRVKNVSRFWSSKVSVPQRGFITCNWNWKTTIQPQPWLSSSSQPRPLSPFVSGMLLLTMIIIVLSSWASPILIVTATDRNSRPFLLWIWEFNSSVESPFSENRSNVDDHKHDDD